MNMQSHPTRVRGLKLVGYNTRYPEYKVAPHAGAWIETSVVMFINQP